MNLIKRIKELFKAEDDEPEASIMSMCPECGSNNIKYKTEITNFADALNGKPTEYKTTAICRECGYIEEANCGFMKIPKFK